MQPTAGEDHELRAARNQSLFREVNERLLTPTPVNGRFEIACECADIGCAEKLEIRPQHYDEVRADRRHFVVLPAHIYPEVEKVVDESDAYVVVEKFGEAGEAAKVLGQDTARR